MMAATMDPNADDPAVPAKKKLSPVAPTPTPQQPQPAQAMAAPNTQTVTPQPIPMAPPPIAPVQQSAPPATAPSPTIGQPGYVWTPSAQEQQITDLNAQTQAGMAAQQASGAPGYNGPAPAIGAPAAKRVYTDAAPATAQEKLDDTYDRGWLDVPGGGGNKYNPSTHYINPRTGAAEFLVNGQQPAAPAQNSGPMITGPSGNLIPASSQDGEKYQGPPIDRFGQLITPNTQSDGAGGFRPDVPLDGQTGLPIAGLPTWESTASPTGAPAAIAPVGGSPAASGYTSSGSVTPTGGTATAGAPSGASVNQIDPSNDLRDKSVLPDAGVDRFKLVNDRFNNYLTTALPELRAKTRAATQSAAAGGRTGSGMFRTDLGNLDLAAQRDANSTFSNLLSDATEGTIGDSRSNRDEVRTERGYQTGQEQNAFDRSRQGVFDEDYLKGTDFNRSMQQLLSGESGNPSGALTSIGNNQANAAQDTIGSLVNGVQTSHAAGGSTGPDFASIIAEILKKNGGASPNASPGVVPDEEYGVAY